MRNIKLLIQYDGTRYSGWQSQEHTDKTIQGKIQAVLEQMLGEPVDLQGSGRTDAGVHALGQVANFRTESVISPQEIVRYVNYYLPEDIAVLEAEEVDVRFHSRLNAVRKTYVYRIWNSSVPNVFERKYLYRIEEELDVQAMRQAARLLCGTHDFRAFCSNKRMKKSTVRTLESIVLEKKGAELCVVFTGNGFLYNMVRILTGTLIEVGLHRRQPEDMTELLASREREQAGFTAPAKGLFLKQVEYC